MADDWRRDVLGFWFGLDEQRHWTRDDAIDAEIARRFGAVWREERARPAADFLDDPEAALAAIILFDQFPRNMFRDDPRAFATDSQARAIADAMVERGWDAQIARERRHFVYMPFEHSERLADQDRSLALFAAMGDDFYTDFAAKHRDVIVRFGRFPHRNEALGRASTPQEEAFGLEPAW